MNSQRGEIRSAWERNGDRVTLNVQIPANMTATVSAAVRRRRSSRLQRKCEKHPENHGQKVVRSRLPDR